MRTVAAESEAGGSAAGHQDRRSAGTGEDLEGSGDLAAQPACGRFQRIPQHSTRFQRVGPLECLEKLFGCCGRSRPGFVLPPLAKDLGGREARRRFDDDEVEGPAEWARFDQLTPAATEGGGGGIEEEIDVASEAGGQSMKRGEIKAEPPEAVESGQCGGGIARSPSHAGLHRDPLGQVNPDSLPRTRFVFQQLRRPDNQVVAAGGEEGQVPGPGVPRAGTRRRLVAAEFEEVFGGWIEPQGVKQAVRSP